jgi:Transglycosylase SLT domain
MRLFGEPKRGIKMIRGSLVLVLHCSAFVAPALGQDLSSPSLADENVGVPDSASQGADGISAVCRMIKSAASANDIPPGFLVRVIWQESRFKSDAVGPLTRSGAQAIGIAQFMPATAAERHLNSPFDPTQALPKAAEFLRDLRSEFGNLGLAAAAYNAGPQRVRDWLAGKRTLPGETRAYVQIVTGRDVAQWARQQPLQMTGVTASGVPCSDIARLEVPAASTGPLRKAAISVPQSGPRNPTWAAQLIGEQSEDKAIARYVQLRKKHPELLSGFEPTVLRDVLGRSTVAAWHRVRIIMDARQVAESLCARLQSSGEHCIVQLDYSR